MRAYPRYMMYSYVFDSLIAFKCLSFGLLPGAVFFVQLYLAVCVDFRLPLVTEGLLLAFGC